MTNFVAGVGDKKCVSHFLRNAQGILDVARAASGEDCDLTLLVDGGGAIRVVSDAGWQFDSLRAHYGAAAAYRVRRAGSRVRIEGASGGDRCLLESGPIRRIPRSCEEVEAPLADARGSETTARVCNLLPSRDRKGAVAQSDISQLLTDRAEYRVELALPGPDSTAASRFSPSNR